jgi:hypothetical protein
MTCPGVVVYGLICLVILWALIVVALTWGSTPRTSPFFADWRDVLTAWRETRTRGEKAVLWCLLLAQILRTKGWGIFLASIPGGFAVLSGLCMDLPATIRAASQMLRAIFDIMDLRNRPVPPSVPTP